MSKKRCRRSVEKEEASKQARIGRTEVLFVLLIELNRASAGVGLIFDD